MTLLTAKPPKTEMKYLRYFYHFGVLCRAKHNTGEQNTHAGTPKAEWIRIYCGKTGLCTLCDWGPPLIHLISPRETNSKGKAGLFCSVDLVPRVTPGTTLLITTVLRGAFKSVLVMALFRMSRSPRNDPFLIKRCVASNRKGDNRIKAYRVADLCGATKHFHPSRLH